MVLGMGQDSLTNNTSVQKGNNHQRVASTKHNITHFGDLGKPQNHVRNDTGRNPWAVLENTQGTFRERWEYPYS